MESKMTMAEAMQRDIEISGRAERALNIIKRFLLHEPLDAAAAYEKLLEVHNILEGRK